MSAEVAFVLAAIAIAYFIKGRPRSPPLVPGAASALEAGVDGDPGSV